MIQTSGLTDGLDPISFQLRNSSRALSPGPRVGHPEPMPVFGMSAASQVSDSVSALRPSAFGGRISLASYPSMAEGRTLISTPGQRPIGSASIYLVTPLLRHFFFLLQPLCQSGGVSGSIRN